MPHNHTRDLRMKNGKGFHISQNEWNTVASAINNNTFTSTTDIYSSHGIPYSIGNAAITMAVTSSYPVQVNLEMNPLYETGAEINKRLNYIEIPNALKNFRILGLMAIISYMIVILFVWIYANIDGYVYFLAGEPNLAIKYTEWLLGFAGIFVAIDLLRKELDELV